MKLILIIVLIYFIINYFTIKTIDDTWEEHLCSPLKKEDNYYLFTYENCSTYIYSEENFITSQQCWVKTINDKCFIELNQPYLTNYYIYFLKIVFLLLVPRIFVH